VESRTGEGTTFKIYLPAAENRSILKIKAPSQLFAQGGNETILVVEDEPALRMLVVEILQLYGYRVFDASSGVVALEVWKEHKGKIDLLLTDMVMPDGISGRELADMLLLDNPDLKIIYTSGYSPGMAGKDTALLVGFNFLAKPYPPSRLAEVVRLCLNKTSDGTNLSSPPILKKTIFVVEDEPDLLDLISELLSMEGHTVLRASYAEEAFEVWQKNSDNIDLLLTDLTLPKGISGVMLAEKFQAEKPSLKILYSSGHNAEVVKSKFGLPEDINFLQKPFQPNSLGRAVQNALNT